MLSSLTSHSGPMKALALINALAQPLMRVSIQPWRPTWQALEKDPGRS